MGVQLLRYLVLLGASLLAGALLASLDAIRDVDVGRWSLDQLVHLAAFTLAAMIAVSLGRLRFPSGVLTRALGAAGYALGAWLLFEAVRDVLVPGWLDTAELLFAGAVIALAGWLLWVLFTGFDEIVAAARRVPAAAALPAAAPGTTHCTQCGTPFGPGQKFCGACGAARG